MSLPNYNTFAEKDAIFHRERIDESDALLSRLKELESDGYFFRGQSDAGWKLYSLIQRRWEETSNQHSFQSAEPFNEAHLRYQQQHAENELAKHTRQRNDLADSSALQHYGSPTPFLDFTSEISAALYFAMDGMEAPSGRETSQRFSIYAWKPGEGPATASHNDMTNWEQVVEYSGGIDGAVSLDVLKRLTVFYIKQDSGKFLQIANERIDLQNGLFVYSPKAVREGLPYEVIFTGHNSSLVADTHPGEESIAATSLPADPEIAELQQLCTESLNKTNLKPFIPRMICLDVDKTVADDVRQDLATHGVTKDALGLASDDWARQHYESFLKTLGT